MRKIEFKIIQNSDYSDEIRNILDEEEMESLVQVKYEKMPNLFESLQKDSQKTPIIVWQELMLKLVILWVLEPVRFLKTISGI